MGGRMESDSETLNGLVPVELTLRLDGTPIRFALPILRAGNRYYVPLAEFAAQIKDENAENMQRRLQDFQDRSFDSADRVAGTKGEILVNGAPYISLYQLCSLLNLTTYWDYASGTISLCSGTEQAPGVRMMGRTALIRLEDISAGGSYDRSENLQKLRVMGDFMYQAGVPFHIAWIPRFVDPPNGIDNDISKQYSMFNADFLFTLEYLMGKDGVIGLHGYTHQYGDEVSGMGTEFSENRNSSEEDIRARVQAAIDTANRLELPIGFFESPHYASTAFQQSIIEQYFEVIYESYVGLGNQQVIVSPRNQHTLYVPTPLDYVEGDNGIGKMLRRIRNLGESQLASLFYHPYNEFDYITLEQDRKGCTHYTYAQDSPLHRMVAALYEKGCEFFKVTQLGQIIDMRPP